MDLDWRNRTMPSGRELDERSQSLKASPRQSVSPGIGDDERRRWATAIPDDIPADRASRSLNLVRRLDLVSSQIRSAITQKVYPAKVEIYTSSGVITTYECANCAGSAYRPKQRELGGMGVSSGTGPQRIRGNRLVVRMGYVYKMTRAANRDKTLECYDLSSRGTGYRGTPVR